MIEKTNYFRSLYILHKSMLYGLCFIIAVIFYLIWSQTVTPLLHTKDVSKLIFGLIIAGVAFIWISIFLFQYRIKKIAAGTNAVEEKLLSYRKWCIIRWAVMEAATVCFIVAYLLSGIKEILLLQILMIGLFFISGVNKRKAAQHLNMPPESIPVD